MYRKVDEYGNVKRTSYAPGTYIVEPNPKRVHTSDVVRILVKPVVNGLKVKLPEFPARETLFDNLERPTGYQAITPTPRTIAGVQTLSAETITQGATLEKLLVDAPDKTNVRFWTRYDTWTDGTRIATIRAALTTGPVNLVPQEVNAAMISRWDWAVWFLKNMTTNRLVKKYPQTATKLLTLFFTSANAADVAQGTVGTGAVVVPTWGYDEFTIVRTACQQLGITSDPEQYGFAPPFKVLPTEFNAKTASILIFLTAHSTDPMPAVIATYRGNPLNFGQVKMAITGGQYQVDMRARIIERIPAAVAPVPAPGPVPGPVTRPVTPPGPVPGPGARPVTPVPVPPGPPGPLTRPVNPVPGPPGPPGPTTPTRPPRTTPTAPTTPLAPIPVTTNASGDFYEWEDQLEQFLVHNNGLRPYAERVALRATDPIFMRRLLFESRKTPEMYYQLAGGNAVLHMRAKFSQVNGHTATQSMVMIGMVETLVGSQDEQPGIGNRLDSRRNQPLSGADARALAQTDIPNLNKWINVIRDQYDANLTDDFNAMMTALHAPPPAYPAPTASPGRTLPSTPPRTPPPTRTPTRSPGTPPPGASILGRLGSLFGRNPASPVPSRRP